MSFLSVLPQVLSRYFQAHPNWMLPDNMRWMSCSSPYFWWSNAEDLYYFFNNKTPVAAPCHTCSFPKPFRKESNHLIIYPFSINPSVKISACSRQETELASKQCACTESQESDTKLLLLFYNWEEDTMSSCCCWPCKDFDWCFYYTAGLSSRSISSNERPLVSTTLFAIYKTAATHTAENPK